MMETQQLKRRPLRALLTAALLIALTAALTAAVVALTLNPFRYHLGRYALGEENYPMAEALFTDLGDYRDAKTLLRESTAARRYAEAEALFAAGDYDAARELYRTLGTYADAVAKSEMAWNCDFIVSERESLLEMLKMGIYSLDSACMAAEILADNYPYPYVRPLFDPLYEALACEALALAESGESLQALSCLQSLERQDAAGSLRSEMAALPPLQRGVPYADTITATLPDAVAADFTAADYADIILCMYLQGIERLTLPMEGRQHWEETERLFLEGADIADSLLPSHASVYDPWYIIYYDGSDRTTDLKLELRPNADIPFDQCVEHLQAIRAFAEETVTALEEELLLTGAMDARQKSRVLYDWVCWYLQYDENLYIDEDMAIHDTALAIETRRGVCECFNALYFEMCNLAGVPTWGQIGDTNEDNDSLHIWAFQTDESGALFYTDTTWGDDVPAIGEATDVDAFLADMLANSYWIESDDGNYRNLFSENKYFWQTALWDSHKPNLEAEALIAYCAEHSAA